MQTQTQTHTVDRVNSRSCCGDIGGKLWIITTDRDGNTVERTTYREGSNPPDGTEATAPHPWSPGLRVAYRWPKVVGGLLTLVGIALACWALMQGGLCAVVGGVVLA